MGLDMTNDALASFVCVDMEGVEVFTDAVERFVLRPKRLPHSAAYAQSSGDGSDSRSDVHSIDRSTRHA